MIEINTFKSDYKGLSDLNMFISGGKSRFMYFLGIYNIFRIHKLLKKHLNVIFNEKTSRNRSA